MFPDGELHPVETSIKAAEAAGFQVRDLESLRPSHALTLRRWIKNLEENPLVSTDDERIRHRLFRLYLAGSTLTFESDTGGSDVYQMVAVKPDRPWTLGRRFMIAEDHRWRSSVDGQRSTVDGSDRPIRAALIADGSPCVD